MQQRRQLCAPRPCEPTCRASAAHPPTTQHWCRWASERMFRRAAAAASQVRVEVAAVVSRGGHHRRPARVVSPPGLQYTAGPDASDCCGWLSRRVDRGRLLNGRGRFEKRIYAPRCSQCAPLEGNRSAALAAPEAGGARGGGRRCSRRPRWAARGACADGAAHVYLARRRRRTRGGGGGGGRGGGSGGRLRSRLHGSGRSGGVRSSLNDDALEIAICAMAAGSARTRAGFAGIRVLLGRKAVLLHLAHRAEAHVLLHRWPHPQPRATNWTAARLRAIKE